MAGIDDLVQHCREAVQDPWALLVTKEVVERAIADGVELLSSEWG